MIDRFVRNMPYCSDSDRWVRSAVKQLTPFEEQIFGNAQISSCRVSQQACVEHLQNCFGRGQCVNGKCVCNSTYAGTTCAYSKMQLTTTSVADEQQAVPPQEWIYYQLPSFGNGLAWLDSSIKVVNATNNKFTTYTVGEGYGMNAPTNKVCLYVKRNEIPTWLRYDFVTCIDREGKLDMSFSVR